MYWDKGNIGHDTGERDIEHRHAPKKEQRLQAMKENKAITPVKEK